MLKANRVQNSMNDFARHNVHNRQNIEIDDDINIMFVVIIFVFNVRIMFFIVVVIVFSFAFIVSIVFFLVELISISLEIELFTTFVRCVKLFFAKNAFFDDDDNDIFNF